MNKNNCLGIVLCGLGRMGLIHLKNILSNRQVELLYIVEVDLDKAKKVIKEYNLTTTTKPVHFDDAAKSFTDPSVDAVIIATPTDTHHPLLLSALNSGKHVLCEKPIARELDAVLACYDIAKKNGLVLLCAFNRRFDPQLQQLVNSKDGVGKLQTIKICSRDSPRPSIDYLKISGGIFHDCLIHDIDLVRWITGENPETIYCMGYCHDPEIKALDDADTVFTAMKFRNGVLVHVESQRDCVFGYDQTVEIYGDKGNLLSTNPRKSGIVTNGGRQTDEIFSSFPTRYAAAYKEELQHLIDLIKDRSTTPLVCARDTVLATCLSQAAEDSWREGKIINIDDYLQKFNKNGMGGLL